MNKDQRIRLGIVAFALLMVLLFGIMPLFSYRETGSTRVRNAQRDYTTLSALVALTKPLNQQSGVQDTSLFGRINKEAERLRLSSRIETLRPVVMHNEQGGERIDLRMTGLYLEQSVAWLFALESYTDIRIESLTITRTGNNLLDMDMVVIRQGTQQ